MVGYETHYPETVRKKNMEPNEDNFEVSFRILGNEFFGMRISSQSKAKNWAFFGILTLVAITILVNVLSPSLIALANSVL